MNVRLIASTSPKNSQMANAAQLLGYCARVSNPSNQENHETAEKLLAYCARNGHWSVFEMANLVLEIEAPRDIARQILRHRSFSFQEFSQRYAQSTEFTTREPRLQDDKNRQNSLPMDDDASSRWFLNAQETIQKITQATYEQALSKGIAKECARVILPEGLTMSRMYVNGTLRSWIHYCEVRRHESTQKEHRVVAEKVWQIVCDEFPCLEAM